MEVVVVLMMLRRVFGPDRDEVRGEWKNNYIMRSLLISTA